MGRGWIQGYKDEQAAKKGNVFTKLSKEISVAARLGGPDPDGNARLRAAIEDARAASMPRDNIEKAIKKGAGLLEGVNYEDVMYEGYAPHGVAVMVEALTDNRNRTVSELKSLFKDYSGNLGEPGSVAWMFQKVGIVEATNQNLPEDLETEAIEVNAQNVEKLDKNLACFYTDPTDLDSVKTALTSRGWGVAKAEFAYEAKNQTKLEDAKKKEVVELLQAVSAHDDVRRVHTALA
ncbi:MAG: YebC/PmpR family DNA-binding transcriptional regulator [Oligoflexia bacterium]|nr:YebC/PmpR family DNA-binding transcriptional regulator [Oligoflexia bacterium]